MTDPTPTVRTTDDVRSWVLALLQPENAPAVDGMTARQLAWQVVDLTAPEPGAGWDESLDSDKVHERRVVAREDWWELNHGNDGESRG